jgi:hypothetical protein
VMVLPNAKMSLMKETRSAASRTSNSTMSIQSPFLQVHSVFGLHPHLSTL